MARPVFLTSEELRGLAPVEAFVEAVHDAYRERGDGAPATVRSSAFADDPAGKLTGYTAILPEAGVMGGYLYAAGFADRDAHFLAPLFDAESGAPLALLDGAWMNPFKTGAAGAVAVDALARESASTIGLIGSGAQAAGQLQATATVRDVETVRVFSPTRSNRRAFADEFDARLEPSVRSVETAREAVSGADIVITATTSSDPVLEWSWIAPGTHITAMGQYHPRKREIDGATVAHARYVLDLIDRADLDAGALMLAQEEGLVDDDHVYGELGEIVAGHKPGRTTDEEVTVFDSGGTAIETVAAAGLLYERAIERDLGQPVEWFGGNDMLTGRD